MKGYRSKNLLSNLEEVGDGGGEGGEGGGVAAGGGEPGTEDVAGVG